MWLSHLACLRGSRIQSKAQIGQDGKGCEAQTPYAGAESPSLFVVMACSGRFTGNFKISRSGTKVSHTFRSPTNRKLIPFIALKQLTHCSEIATFIAVNANNAKGTSIQTQTTWSFD